MSFTVHLIKNQKLNDPRQIVDIFYMHDYNREKCDEWKFWNYILTNLCSYFIILDNKNVSV